MRTSLDQPLDHFTMLPDELLVQILQFLDRCALGRTARVAKRWNDVVNFAWKERARLDFVPQKITSLQEINDPKWDNFSRAILYGNTLWQRKKKPLRIKRNNVVEDDNCLFYSSAYGALIAALLDICLFIIFFYKNNINIFTPASASILISTIFCAVTVGIGVGGLLGGTGLFVKNCINNSCDRRKEKNLNRQHQFYYAPPKKTVTKKDEDKISEAAILRMV